LFLKHECITRVATLNDITKGTQLDPMVKENAYFRRIPKNMRNLEVSSGDFSTATDVGFIDSVSDDDDGAVDAGEGS
jgi:hypothetical protein